VEAPHNRLACDCLAASFEMAPSAERIARRRSGSPHRAQPQISPHHPKRHADRSRTRALIEAVCSWRRRTDRPGPPPVRSPAEPPRFACSHASAAPATQPPAGRAGGSRSAVCGHDASAAPPGRIHGRQRCCVGLSLVLARPIAAYAPLPVAADRTLRFGTDPWTKSGMDSGTERPPSSQRSKASSPLQRPAPCPGTAPDSGGPCAFSSTRSSTSRQGPQKVVAAPLRPPPSKTSSG